MTQAKGAFDDLAQELGATSEDLAAAEQDVKNAQATADQAQEDADAAQKAAEEAKQRDREGKAEADKATADANAAESKAAIAGDCAKAYVFAVGSLFGGEDIKAQASKVSARLEGITSECQAALAGTQRGTARRLRVRPARSRRARRSA